MGWRRPDSSAARDLEAEAPDTSPPGAADVRPYLGKILSSPQFAASPRLQQFLTFIVEEALDGGAESIKETVVAMRVFNRGSSFDSRTDSVVRVEARNLRNRLRDYYLDGGRTDEVVISLPKGSYVPSFLRNGKARRPGVARGYGFPVGWRLAAGLLTALGVVAYLVLRSWLPSPPPLSNVAILPFDNAGATPQGAYISDALVDDLMVSLARVSTLRVAARSSAFRVRDKESEVRDIGRRLGVGAVVEGSVRKVGERWRVTVRLLKTSDGYHLWADAFDGSETDLPLFRERTAVAIARALGDRRTEAVATYIPKPAAQDLFWRARYLLRKGAEGRAEAVDNLQRAVEVDPAFSQAHSALAGVFALMAFHGEEPKAEFARKAREAARAALVHDPASGEAYVALAMMDYSADSNWPSADRNFRRALELSPSLARGHQAYALGLLTRGQFDAALAELKQAKMLDPLSQVVANETAVVLYCARRYKEAIATATRTLEVDPTFVQAFVIRAAGEAGRGDFRKAEADFNRAAKVAGRGAWLLGRLGNSYARTGRRQQALDVLREIEAQDAQGSPSMIYQAFVYAGLGEVPRALDCLERAADRHETDANFIAVEPLLDPLRSDPRFTMLRRRLGL